MFASECSVLRSINNDYIIKCYGEVRSAAGITLLGNLLEYADTGSLEDYLNNFQTIVTGLTWFSLTDHVHMFRMTSFTEGNHALSFVLEAAMGLNHLQSLGTYRWVRHKDVLNVVIFTAFRCDSPGHQATNITAISSTSHSSDQSGRL